MLGCLATVPGAAQAAPDFSIKSTFPSSVVVEDKGLPASVTVTAEGELPGRGLPDGSSSGSTSKYFGFCALPSEVSRLNEADSGTNCTQAGYCPPLGGPPADPACPQAQLMGPPFDQGITLTPSCAQTTPPDEATFATAKCAAGDAGVFTLSPTATGAPLSDCAGTTFDVTVIDPALGMVRFAPRGGPVVLGPPGSFCRIDFTFDVNRLPAGSSATTGGKTRAFSAAGGYHMFNEFHVVNVKAVSGGEIRVTPPPTTREFDYMKAFLSESKICTPKATRQIDRPVRVTVTVEGDPRNVKRVAFRRNGRVVRVLKKGSGRGRRRFVLRVNPLGLRPGRRYEIRARVILKARGVSRTRPPSFSRTSRVRVKPLRPVEFVVSRDCDPEIPIGR